MRSVLAVVLFTAGSCLAETLFVEAEDFIPSCDGWRVNRNAQARRASRAATLNGSAGPGDATASKSVTIGEAGPHRIWVRYMQHQRWRGPFRLAVLAGKKELAGKDFDVTVDRSVDNWEYRWDYLDVDLPGGELALRLSKCQKRNCSSYVRNVDCVLITTDRDLVPHHLDYGPQTYLRVTLGECYRQGAYVHVFADHYRDPWYGHFNLSKRGAAAGLGPPKESLLAAGETTPWCNITPMLYQDSGAILNISIRHSYRQWADRLAAKFEFATAADETSVVRTFVEDRTPNGLVIICPPDLATAENRGRLRIDRDFAEETGRFADAFDWPKLGHPPKQFPFLVTADVGGYNLPVARDVTERELKTLGYFGFSNPAKTSLGGGTWQTKNGSFCAPDLARMQAGAARRAEEFKQSGRSLDDVVYVSLTDEPTGQPTSFMVKDPAYLEAFRAWLMELGKAPADLLVADWDAVRPVVEADRDRLSALHYYTQKFRTVALGRFMAAQRKVLAEAFGKDLPVLANFSDGATYHANFYCQGVDYFVLLNETDQNAIWGEDWANNASTYLCASYNVDLMRAAARRRGQVIGHFLVAYAGRTPWDTQLKGVSELARGVKILRTYCYGPSWSTHSGGPWWRSSVLYATRDKWYANAELVRLVGWAEDFLVPAMPAPAETAILYSSSSDIWTVGLNYAYGFERMHTWLALAHGQVPVDFLSEQDVAEGRLAGYKVCYFTGPNLTRSAADTLAEWTRSGGTLWLSAGAGARDEYNRPMDVVEKLLPARRGPAEELQKFTSAGKFLYSLDSKGEVRADNLTLNVLAVRQSLAAPSGGRTLATFDDGSPALVRGQAGRGTVYAAGFLPALYYIKTAEDARRALSREQADPAAQPTEATVGEFDEPALLKGSYNPWEFPGPVREFILQPVRSAQVDPPVRAGVALVDAVYMTCDRGILVPLANYTLTPIKDLELSVRVPREVSRVESAHHGELKYRQAGDRVSFVLPLGCTDFVKVHYK